MLWVGLGLIVVGLVVAFVGGGFRFGSFRGNLAHRVRGNVSMTYTEASPAQPTPKAAPSGEDRFLKWGGFTIAFAGLVVSALKLVVG